MDLDATQAIPLDDWEDETQAIDLDDESEDDSQRKPVGYLKVFTQKGVKETLYPVYEGENKIGRHENIDISIPMKALSKHHACIQVSSDIHLIFDTESRNKTRRNKMYLAPTVRYELKHEDNLTFADVICQYLIAAEMKKVDLNDGSDTGSETGSESMFLSAEDHENSEKHDGKDPTQIQNDDESSSDIMAQAQRCTKLELKTPKHLTMEATICYAEDSDETDDDMETKKTLAKKIQCSQTVVKESPQQIEKPTLVLQSDSDSDTDIDNISCRRKSPDKGSGSVDQLDCSDYANAATQACDPTEDSEEYEEDKSIFCAATQAYGVQDDDEEEDEEEEGGNEASLIHKTEKLIKPDDSNEKRNQDLNYETVNMAEGATLAYDATVTEDDEEEIAAEEKEHPAEEDEEMTLAYSDTRHDGNDADMNDDMFTAETQAYGIDDIEMEGDDDDDDDDGLQSTQAYDGNNADVKSTQDIQVDIKTNSGTEIAVKDEDLESTQTTSIEDGETLMLKDEVEATQVTCDREDEDETQAVDVPMETDISQHNKGEQKTLMIGDDEETQAIEDYDSDIKKSAVKKGKGRNVKTTMSVTARHSLGREEMEEEDHRMDDEATQVCDDESIIQDENTNDENDATQTMEDESKLDGDATQVINDENKTEIGDDDDDDEEEEEEEEEEEKRRAIDIESHHTDNQCKTDDVKQIAFSQSKAKRPRSKEVVDDGNKKCKSVRGKKGQEKVVVSLKNETQVIVQQQDMQKTITDDDEQKISGKRKRGKIEQTKAVASTSTSIEAMPVIGGKENGTAVETEEKHGSSGRGQRGRGRGKTTASGRGQRGRGRGKTTASGREQRGRGRGKTTIVRNDESISKQQSVIEEDNKVKGKSKDKFERQSAGEDEADVENDAKRKKSVKSPKGRSVVEVNTEVEMADESNVKGGRRKSTRGRQKKMEKENTHEGESTDTEPGTSGINRREDLNDEGKKSNLPSADEDDLLACTQAYGEDDIMASTHVLSGPTSDDLTGETQVYGVDGDDEFVADSEEDTMDDGRRGPLKIPSMLGRVPVKSALVSPKNERSPKKTQKVAFNVKEPATSSKRSAGTRRSVAIETKDDKVDNTFSGSRRKSVRGRSKHEESKNDDIILESRDSTTGRLNQSRKSEKEDKPTPSTSKDDSGKDVVESRKGKKTKQTNKTDRGQSTSTLADEEVKTSLSLTPPLEDSELSEEVDIVPKRRTRGRQSVAKETAVREKQSVKQGKRKSDNKSTDFVQTEFKKPDGKITRGRLSKVDTKDIVPSKNTKKTVVKRSSKDDSAQQDEETEESGKERISKENGDSRRKTGRGRSVSVQDGNKEEKTSEMAVTPSTRPRRETASPTLRRLSSSMSPKVMFTGVVDKTAEKTVKSLGGSLVDSVYECTHLVTDKVRRTVKFLCGLSRGVPIINPEWLDQCKKARKFLDAEQYLLKDKQGEDQYGFDLSESRQKALQSSVLQGYKIHVTGKVVPPAAVLKDIIKCAGGQHLKQMPKKSDEHILIISCDEDKSVCQAAIKASIQIVNPECLLTGLLRQEIDVESFRLFAVGEEQATESNAGKRKASETTSTGTTRSKRRRK